ncbi:MAG: bifunctional riboflavin kinase/FAD synthetase [Anaerolineales bacterium]|jgi:riboflavin kinase/FMN adenylyltransferase
MQHFQSISDLFLEESWIAIGIFDGVHLGHQSIIRNLVTGATSAGSPSVVVTFFPHPKKVLYGISGQFYLTSPEERAELLSDLGVDYVITQLFDEKFSKTSAVAYMRKLHDHLKMKCLNIGVDFALGRDREGNIELLEKIGNDLGYSVNVVSPKSFNGLVISSSMIRNALLSGDVAYSHELLGHPYQVDGVVIPGDGRGRLLGIPTANVDVWEEKLLPKVGVYACRVLLEGSSFGAVTNIGVRPTFDSDSLATRVETHILNFDRDLYGKKLRIQFLKRLREEIRFKDVQKLIEQILCDIESTKEILKIEREGGY